MCRSWASGSALIALWIFCAAASAAQQPRKQVIGYFPSWKWNDKNCLMTPDRIPYEKLTAINYAFFAPRPDGSIAGKDSVGDAMYLGPANPHSLLRLAHLHSVRVILSIGGWEDSDNFPEAVSTAELRARFAHACMEALDRYGFDGIDIDWEFPGYADHKGSPADKGHCTLMFRALRDSLLTRGKAAGKTFLLTAALPAGTTNLSGFDLDEVAACLDQLNIMTYDFNGPWDSLANHNAPLYSAAGADPSRCVDAAFRLFHDRFGIPSAKINLGAPFYGVTYSHCAGINRPHAGPDTLHFSRDGAFYYDIARSIGKFARTWDERAQVPTLESASWNTFISYDDPASISAKARYVVDHDACGIIIWEITGDYLPDGSTPLLDAIASEFGRSREEPTK